MGLKKYEIITVGGDKRVRALRSWQVGGRYVNIGDMGGIVYDEKTLSQDGACWLFKGNFGFPGARIGGDSIVDVGEATLSTTGSPAVDILGSSVVVGSKLQFASMQTAADGVVLTAADFEQGDLTYSTGTNWETWKNTSGNFVRLKSPVFMGGVAATLKLDVPGYAVQAFVMDRDGMGTSATAAVSTGAGVTLTVPAGQYFIVKLRKDPVAAIVPVDATAAKITFTGTYEAKLSIVDSRVEINPANSAGTLALRAGGTYTMSSGAKYPDSVIQNSKVSMMVHATANRIITMMAEFINTSAVMDASVEAAPAYIGIYKNVKNLTFTGSVTGDTGVGNRGVIQATDCDNMVVSPTVFPGLIAAQLANMPFIFQGCNVPGGMFYHHAQIANTYKNIDFAKASVDLGKSYFGGTFTLVSSEVEGMYRAYHTAANLFGFLVESYDSISTIGPLVTMATSYGTTIYKDAYVSGKFDIAGTNVFGNKVRSHPLAQVLNVQPRAVQGIFNTVVVGETITGVRDSQIRVSIPLPFRLGGDKAITFAGIPAGVESQVLAVDPTGKIIATSSWANADRSITAYAVHPLACVMFKKTNGGSITPEDLAGATITVYNGCKLVNTGETAINMKGNIRVEDNATLVNASITGSGYFGGNSIASGVTVEGGAYVKDNAVIVVPAGSAAIRSLKMTENAYAAPASLTLNGHLWLSGNSRFTPTTAASGNGDLFMEDNAVISGSVSVSGSLTMKDNAIVSAGGLTVYGDVTVCGSYNQTVNKTWTGKRTITDSNEPEYNNNVKTQYDF